MVLNIQPGLNKATLKYSPTVDSVSVIEWLSSRKHMTTDPSKDVQKGESFLPLAIMSSALLPWKSVWRLFNKGRKNCPLTQIYWTMSINHRDTAICFRLLCYPQELGKGAILCLLVDERARKCGTYMFYVAIKKDEIMVYVKKWMELQSLYYQK